MPIVVLLNVQSFAYLHLGSLQFCKDVFKVGHPSCILVMEMAFTMGASKAGMYQGQS
jgi:hypothetical protein